MLKLGPVSFDAVPPAALAARRAALGIAVWILLLGGGVASSYAAFGDRNSAFEANTSETARRDAVRAMPFDKLSATDKARVESVIADVSIFRRMPTRVIDCEPALYLFLVRHPDVVVNIWEIMKASRLKVRQTGPAQFQVTEAGGTVANMEILCSSRDTQLVYGEGTYQGPLFARAIRGRAVLLLKTATARDADGRFHITSRLDSFVSIEPGGIELLTKTIHPIIGKTADNNFIQTLNFVGSLSRTIETNNRGVQRLATRLEHVPPPVRTQFAELAASLGQKATAAADSDKPSGDETAARLQGTSDR